MAVREQRDNQRSRVYEAEREAWAAMNGGRPYFQTIPSGELADYVASVLDKRSVRSRWGIRPIPQVELSHGGARAYGRHLITFGKNPRNEMIVCHEVAHTLLDGTGYAGHGPEFVGVYLFLVRLMLGEEWAAALSDAFRAKRVRRSNRAIPPVMAVVPKPRAERAKAQRKAKQEEAVLKIQHWLADGVVTKAALRTIIEGKAS